MKIFIISFWIIVALFSCRSRLQRSGCICEEYSVMSKSTKLNLSLDILDPYMESLIYDDSNDLLIYQFWLNASHSTKDCFYLIKGDRIVLLDREFDVIRDTLEFYFSELGKFDFVMHRIIQIMDCENEKPKYKF